MESKQKIRYSQDELTLIKGTFSENEELLKVLRKVFYQMPLTANDLAMLSVNFHKKDALLKVVRKMFLPTLEADLPLQQEIDLWMTIKLKELEVGQASVHLKSIQLWIDYIDQQLKLIEKNKFQVKKPKISFKYLTNLADKIDQEVFAEVLARNTIINHVEQCLQQLLLLAGAKEESPEETIERLSKDSAK